MADMLATTADLTALLGETVDETSATLALELATGAVQAAAGQRLVEVTDDTIDLMGTTGSWLDLPQRPVTAVTSVTLAGTAVTDFTRYGGRLYRTDGWAEQTDCTSWAWPGLRYQEPTPVQVVYSHGYPVGDPGLGLARQATLMLASSLYSNPTGATSLAIDDYREGYGGNAGESGLTSSVRTALRRTYGQRGGLVRLG